MTNAQTQFQKFIERPDTPKKIKTILSRYKPDTEETADDHKTYKRIEEVFRGKYEVVGVFRRGGNGSVYFALHKELNALVLVKTLNPEWAIHQEAERRFKDEAIVTRRIKHPGILEIYDLATDVRTERDEESGAEKTVKQGFIVMEHVPGMDLDDKIKQLSRLGKRMTNNEIAKIGQLAAKALDAAHKEAIIHRDIKPGNIMIIENGELRVKVIDFGIAKQDDPEDRKEHTQAGMIFGTCHYMPPEQAQGHRVTHKADIYSLGATLYELAEGKPPYNGDNQMAILAALMRDPLPPITNPEISDRLKEIIYRCMDKDSSKRYDTMEDLARELATFDREAGAEAIVSMIGRTIYAKKGTYRITRQIGASRDTGGFFVANDMDATIEKIVTIKVTPPNASRAWRERARKEVETLSKIQHPNIARPIDFNEKDDEFDVVFDFVAEASLRELNLQSVSREDKLIIAIQMTEGLRYAHSQGIIHRDIKPGSVFVQSIIGSDPSVKIANFGFAKETTVDTKLTAMGTVVGSEYEYMSPEQQARGKLDQKTDVYSAGLVLREVFFGIKPNQGAEWVKMKRTVDEVDKEIYDLICACLKEKDERPIMAQVNSTLRDFAAKERVSRVTPVTDDDPTGVIQQVPATVQTQQGHGIIPPMAPRSSVIAQPVQAVASPPNPAVATPATNPKATQPQPPVTGTEEIAPNDPTVSLNVDEILGRKKPNRVLMGVSGALVVGTLVAAVGLGVSRNKQRPTEPRIESIMRDASPVIAVPTQVQVDSGVTAQDAQAPMIPDVAMQVQATQVTINANVSGYKVYLPDGTELCNSGRSESCQFEINTTGSTQLELRKGTRRVQLTIDANGNPIETNATFPRVRRRHEEVEGM